MAGQSFGPFVTSLSEKNQVKKVTHFVPLSINDNGLRHQNGDFTTPALLYPRSLLIGVGQIRNPRQVLSELVQVASVRKVRPIDRNTSARV